MPPGDRPVSLGEPEIYNFSAPVGPENVSGIVHHQESLKTGAPGRRSLSLRHVWWCKHTAGGGTFLQEPQ